jgi:hypothetical protein
MTLSLFLPDVCFFSCWIASAASMLVMLIVLDCQGASKTDCIYMLKLKATL